MTTTVKQARQTTESRNGGGSAAKAKAQDAAKLQSAAALSPFTPIADYAFLSERHTGAIDRGIVLADRLAGFET